MPHYFRKWNILCQQPVGLTQLRTICSGACLVRFISILPTAFLRGYLPHKRCAISWGQGSNGTDFRHLLHANHLSFRVAHGDRSRKSHALRIQRNVILLGVITQDCEGYGNSYEHLCARPESNRQPSDP